MPFTARRNFVMMRSCRGYSPHIFAQSQKFKLKAIWSLIKLRAGAFLKSRSTNCVSFGKTPKKTGKKLLRKTRKPNPNTSEARYMPFLQKGIHGEITLTSTKKQRNAQC
jgi:hypothetical protein